MLYRKLENKTEYYRLDIVTKNVISVRADHTVGIGITDNMPIDTFNTLLYQFENCSKKKFEKKLKFALNKINAEI